MKKNLFLTCAAVAAIVCVAFAAHRAQQSQKMTSPLMRANLEALSSLEDDSKTIYKRYESTCKIYVGAKGKIILLSGAVIKADGNGYVEFDGKVVCASGGEFTCSPVECKDLYEAIFHN